TVEESCGKCTPCRIGNKRLLEMLTKITDGHADEQDLVDLENLANTVKDTSLCGLGKSAPNPILSTLQYFYDEYKAHVTDKKCPAGKCQS
ncbi:MAG: NADH-ubiquinone oxidoreductase-F iron-sulfur binding region domain-containing protein, partial [Clostridia bacterium]